MFRRLTALAIALALIFAVSTTYAESSSYSYLHDRFNKYQATIINDSILKIEVWSRFNAGPDAEPYQYERDLLSTSVTDNSIGLTWLDEEHSAFMLNLMDSENGYFFNEEAVAYFSPDNLDDTLSKYVFRHDNFNEYRAIHISNNLLKIENWSRFDTSSDFYYDHDVTIIKFEEDSNFKWIDDGHNGFTYTMSDPSNGYFTDEEQISFVISQ